MASMLSSSASLVLGQTFTTLHTFTAPATSSPYTNSDGAGPLAALTLGNDGNFYGTASGGGGGGYGTVFKVTTNGALNTLYSFNGGNGMSPIAALTLGSDGNFYGTTLAGGPAFGLGGGSGYGTMFMVTTNGAFSTLVSFNATTEFPDTALTLVDFNGTYQNFYSTLQNGGTSGAGLVFQITTSGTLSNLYSLTGGTNGANPLAALAKGNNGNFYGTTQNGGSSGVGTIFQFSLNGTLTTLASFNGTNGANPRTGLTFGNDGNFYGTTSSGGSTGSGTVFQLMTNGTLNTLVSFSGTNAVNPTALTFGNDGNLYGATARGGVTNSTYTTGMGTIFQVTTNGTITQVMAFNGTNGASPNTLTLGNDGNFYGTTSGGGSSNAGTVFRLSLPPGITAQPQSQTNYAGATVSFLVSSISINPVWYQWQKNGSNLTDGNGLFGTTSNTLTIAGISDSDAGNYRLVLSNAFASVSSSAVGLTVNDSLFIVSEPQSQIVAVGSNVTFNATVYGETPFVYQWYFNGNPLGSPGVGTNTLTYTLNAVGTNQAGNYSVQVVNDYGSLTSSNATLTVVAFPAVIIAQPTNRTNNAGTTAVFSVGVSSMGQASYQWQKNNTNLVNGGNIAGATANTLSIASVGDSDAAVYSVIVANLVGGVTSSNAVLTVIDPPSITAQPLGLQLVLGETAAFNVLVTGTEPLNYQWRFKGTNIVNATNAGYLIQYVGATNTGNYSVVVTNLAGKVTSSNALLTVIVPPTLGLEMWADYPLLSLTGMLGSNFVVQYNVSVPRSTSG